MTELNTQDRPQLATVPLELDDKHPAMGHLLVELSKETRVSCPSCEEPDPDCMQCAGEGAVTEWEHVSVAEVQETWRRMVNHVAEATPQGDHTLLIEAIQLLNDIRGLGALARKFDSSFTHRDICTRADAFFARTDHLLAHKARAPAPDQANADNADDDAPGPG